MFYKILDVANRTSGINVIALPLITYLHYEPTNLALSRECAANLKVRCCPGRSGLGRWVKGSIVDQFVEDGPVQLIAVTQVGSSSPTH